MDSARSPSGSVRRHGRNISHPLRRTATSGPLEDAGQDPLADTPTSPSGASTSDVAQSVLSFEPQAAPAPLPEPELAITRHLTFLSDPDAYSQLFANDVPKPFFDRERQPPLDSELPDLLKGGHYRFAAEKAARDLLASHNNSPQHLLHLLYIRLASLILISRPDLAVQQAAPMIDFLVRNPPGAQDVVPLIPWDLRLLLVRLQAMGASDGGRRGVMALYALASEVRSNIRDAEHQNDESVVALWTSRLQDIGLRVCDALVEMGELETAIRHLATLHDVDSDELSYRNALLRVRVGDTAGAKRYAESLTDITKKKSIVAVLDIADGEFFADSWQSLVDEYPSHELFAQNAAVSLLYAGHIASARDFLEDLVERVPMFPTLLFNLSTIYELCSERAADHKLEFAEKAAAKKPVPDSGGWERANFEFKL